MSAPLKLEYDSCTSYTFTHTNTSFPSYLYSSYYLYISSPHTHQVYVPAYLHFGSSGVSRTCSTLASPAPPRNAPLLPLSPLPHSNKVVPVCLCSLRWKQRRKEARNKAKEEGREGGRSGRKNEVRRERLTE